MYTTQQNLYEDGPGPLYQWAIYDPHGYYLCTVPDKHTADTLLAHLNKD